MSTGELPADLGYIAGKLVVTEAGCWEWQGPRSWNGYAKILGQQGHRLVWKLLRPKPIEGLTLDHLCRNRPCVNPEHCEPVTMKENIRRGATCSSPTCRKGHLRERTPDGRMVCMECRRTRKRTPSVRNHARDAERRRAHVESMAWLPRYPRQPSTQCEMGHQLDVVGYSNLHGYKRCLECQRIASRAKTQRRRERRGELPPRGKARPGYCSRGHELAVVGTLSDGPARCRMCRQLRQGVALR